MPPNGIGIEHADGDVACGLEACGVWDRGTPPPLIADSDIPSVVYVSRRRYDQDLLACLRTRAAVRRQLEIDVPRCVLSYHGERHLARAPPDLSVWLGRYCNQAVLGLPVSLLASLGVVAEPRHRSPLHVHVWDDASASIIKQLRLILPDARQCELVVHVDVQRDSEWVVVSYHFESETECEVRLA